MLCLLHKILWWHKWQRVDPMSMSGVWALVSQWMPGFGWNRRSHIHLYSVWRVGLREWWLANCIARSLFDLTLILTICTCISVLFNYHFTVLDSEHCIAYILYQVSWSHVFTADKMCQFLSNLLDAFLCCQKSTVLCNPSVSVVRCLLVRFCCWQETT